MALVGLEYCHACGLSKGAAALFCVLGLCPWINIYEQNIENRSSENKMHTTQNGFNRNTYVWVLGANCHVYAHVPLLVYCMHTIYNVYVHIAYIADIVNRQYIYIFV